MSCAVTYSEPFESFISTTIRTLYVKELRILEKIIELTMLKVTLEIYQRSMRLVIL